MRAKYSSDISPEKFERIRPLLQGARKRTRSVDLYEVFRAVLYLLRTGCQWRALPSDFPKWRTVHAYFVIWGEPREGASLLEQALKIRLARPERNRGATPAARSLFMDVQSVKDTDAAALLKGYDAGKRVSGIKRHIAVDTQGLPHAVAVSTAEVTDRKGALQALQRCKPALSKVCSLLCDSGYVGEPFAQGVKDILGERVTVQIAKRSELHAFKVMPKRWVVERGFA